jgi:hypothetical protein
VITNKEQLEIALHQLARFKGMLEAMRLHLEETEPTLIPLVSESYRQRFSPRFAITCCSNRHRPPLSYPKQRSGWQFY